MVCMMRPLVGKPNASQYSGTTKNTICKRCGKNLNSLNRTMQDQHETDCKKQKRFGEL